MTNNFKFKVAEKQDGLFTSYHTLYKCTIKNNGKQYTFNYQCNSMYNEPNFLDCMECLLLDASCYNGYDNAEEMYIDLGYEINDYNDLKKAKKMYSDCKRTAKAIKRLFTDSEIEEIENAINKQ